MKAIFSVTLLVLFTAVTSFARSGSETSKYNQVVTNAVVANAEIQAVVNVLAKSRGVTCTAPKADQTVVGTVTASGVRFSVLYNCNAFDQNGGALTNIQNITVKGVAWKAAPGVIEVQLRGLDIVDPE